MMRSFAVVLAFVVLNAIGFVAYRALVTPEASAAHGLAAPPKSLDTFSRATPERQPKLNVSANGDAPASADPSATASPAKATLPPNVSGDAEPDGVEVERDAPRAGDGHHRRHAHLDRSAHPRGDREKPAPRQKPAGGDRDQTSSTQSRPAARDKDVHEEAPHEPAKDDLLEMEANPYKRRE